MIYIYIYILIYICDICIPICDVFLQFSFRESNMAMETGPNIDYKPPFLGDFPASHIGLPEGTLSYKL